MTKRKTEKEYKKELMIDGYPYELEKVYKTKRQAKEKAKSIREMGSLARIVSRKGVYLVYAFWSLPEDRRL